MLALPPNPRTALIIVDMQAYYFRDEERRQNLDSACAAINRLSAAFDVRALPVYHVISSYKADRSDWDLKMLESGVPEFIEGTPEVAILPQIEVRPEHHVLTKTRYSAFFKTDLAQQLQAARIDRAAVAGAYTHHCVNATIIDAYCYNFVPCLVRDAVLSHRPEESAVMVERMRRNGYHILSADELIAELNGVLNSTLYGG